MDRKLICAVAICSVAVLGAVLFLYNPWTALSRTLGTADIRSIALHRAEGPETLFLVFIPVENPTRVPVTITWVNIRMLVNGTDHLSTEIQQDPILIRPGKATEIQRIVRLTGSPIGFQGEETRMYKLEIIIEMSATARSLGLGASNSVTLSDAIDWYYNKIP